MHSFDPLPPSTSTSDQFEYWYQQGETLANLGHYDESLVCFERSLQIQPNHVNALVFRGVVLIHLMRYQDALDSLNAALSHTPHHQEALVFKGAALNHLGRYKECYAAYNDALEGDSKRQHYSFFIELLRTIRTLWHRPYPYSK